MVVDDVRELPNTPLVVAEGTTVPASVISSGITDADHSVWLVSTAEFQRSQLANHSAGARKLYTILRDAITRETEVHGAPVIQVDGQRGVDEIFELVEDRFTYAIHDGSRAETIDERRGLLREANIAVVEQVRGFYRRPWAEGDPETVVRIFVCECGDTYCEADVEATVLDAATQPVVAAGHG